jgi:hypothetical protein
LEKDPYGRSTTVLGTTTTDFNFTGLYRHSKGNLDLAYDRLGFWTPRIALFRRGRKLRNQHEANTYGK